jgi:hypothetical protein
MMPRHLADELTMKNLTALSIVLAAAASIVTLKAAGFWRDRHAIADIDYAYGDFKNGTIVLMKEAPFGLGLHELVYRNYEIEYVEYHEGVDGFRTGLRGLWADVHEGGPIDCLIGRCGRIILYNHFR